MKPAHSCALRLAVLCLLLALPAGALIGAIPVIDSTNLSQNIAQVLHAVQQIEHLLAQLETMERNLERVEDPSWRDLREQVQLLQSLVAQGTALAYTAEDLFDTFRQILPGYKSMQPGAFEDVYGEWTALTLDTLAATLDSAGAQAQDHLSTQDQLAELQAIADAAAGNLEALNASNLLQGHIAQEVAKLNQLLAASLNAQNVVFGYRLNLEANQEATQRDMIQQSLRGFHHYTGQGAFTGIPAGWPFPCFGCNAPAPAP